MTERVREGEVPAIIGLGSKVGGRVITNEQIDKMIGRNAGFIDRLMRMSGVGIEKRNWVYKGRQTASTLGTDSSKQALKMGETKKSDVNVIFVATGSSDFVAVPAAAIIQDRLGLRSDVRADDVYAACPGWIKALHNACLELTSPLGHDGSILVVGVEVLSPIRSAKKPDTFAIFADASGAALVKLVVPDKGAPTNMAFDHGSDGQYAKNLNVPAGGSKHPTTIETVEKDMHSVHMEGRLVKDQAVKRMSEKSQSVLIKAGVPIEEVDLLVPHQANLAIIRETAEALNFPMEKVFVNIDHMGNTSAASIPVALHEAYVKGVLRRNQIVVLVSFGAGMTYAAAVLPMVGLPKR